MKFPARRASVVNVNNRKENHGQEEKVLAVDVKFLVAGAPDILEAFDANLRRTFFQEGQGKDHLPRHPELGAVEWVREYEGAQITIGEKTFKDVKLKGFTFEVREGGVVTVGFTAAFRPNPDDVGPLAELIKEDTTVEFVTQFDLVDEANKTAEAEAGGKKRRNGKQDPTAGTVAPGSIVPLINAEQMQAVNEGRDPTAIAALAAIDASEKTTAH